VYAIIVDPSNPPADEGAAIAVVLLEVGMLIAGVAVPLVEAEGENKGVSESRSVFFLCRERFPCRREAL